MILPYYLAGELKFNLSCILFPLVVTGILNHSTFWVYEAMVSNYLS